MTETQIAELFERLGRLVAATKQKTGEGSSWNYTFPDGETHRYVIRGLKSHAEAEDSAFNLLIWIWNAKDYLKRRADIRGQNAQIVEDVVNADPALAVCADLANRLKHGELRCSRSGWYPKFGVMSFTAPQAALGSLTFGAFEVAVEIADPSLVEFNLPVIDQSDAEVGNAFEFAARALSALEQLKARIEEAV
ncbi:MAG: hypothetical protein KGL31_04460 [candidate division NC10 bacterium]|nr:hypothetical protein [candidate division NC10 bacterium]MDE2321154.1 hypothetical protein [candidate division NC10 bacterium]